MTVKRVGLKVSHESPSARTSSFVDLMADEPLAVLGSMRNPELVSSPIVASARTCFGPRGACLTSPTGPLWICDTGHHRLLGWRSLPDSDGAAADWLIGQRDFDSEGRNGKGKVSAYTVNVPTGICVIDAGMAVADAWNHRVLIWHRIPQGSNTPADLVLGQADFASGDANRGADRPGPDTLHWPYGVYYDQGKLFVADTGNRRVLVWNQLPRENGQRADFVLGQSDFSTRDENAGMGPSAMSMRWPHGIAMWHSKLCVTDAGNNRILIWNELPMESGLPADFVIGQHDVASVDFNQSLYWPRAGTLNMPYGISTRGDWLIVADTANSRVLGWNINLLGTTGDASALFGQKEFHNKGDNRWQPACSNSLCWPYAVQVIDEYAAISDSGNNRVSIWRLTV